MYSISLHLRDERFVLLRPSAAAGESGSATTTLQRTIQSTVLVQQYCCTAVLLLVAVLLLYLQQWLLCSFTKLMDGLFYVQRNQRRLVSFRGMLLRAHMVGS